ncbi:MAG: NUDIX hydrolase [Candidatus Spechtbacterales bacterium]
MVADQLSKTGTPTTCPIAVIVRDEKILLGMRNYTADKWKEISVWIPPGGRCEADETVEMALRREIREEVGITRLEITDYIGEAPGAREGDTIVMFFCSTEEDPVLREPENFSEWRWVPAEELVDGSPFVEVNPPAFAMIKEFLKKKLSS